MAYRLSFLIILGCRIGARPFVSARSIGLNIIVSQPDWAQPIERQKG
jgi:hypothetical protein